MCVVGKSQSRSTLQFLCCSLQSLSFVKTCTRLYGGVYTRISQPFSECQINTVSRFFFIFVFFLFLLCFAYIPVKITYSIRKYEMLLSTHTKNIVPWVGDRYPSLFFLIASTEIYLDSLFCVGFTNSKYTQQTAA